VSQPLASEANQRRAEWERLELFAHLLSLGRQGETPGEQVLARLRELQDEVDRQRREGSGPLAAELATHLTPLEYDVLVAIAAPEAEPRLGWIFQNLQGGTSPDPTPALLQELLALDAETSRHLYAALAADAGLRRLRLIRAEGDGAYDALKPEDGVVARMLGRPGIDPPPPGATRVRLRPAWEDLVLPAERLEMMREFLNWVRLRDRVFGAWEAAEAGGPVALFSGPSGTGKTLAAAVIATALDWPLFRVDIGMLVSKYIGETEKNLNRLFDAAHGRAMVLQFDEADALFSKRGEVKEARDRYANMEVSHLLARVESHRGPCILTTNLRTNLDSAFVRRFQVVIDFPRPDPAARAELWSRLLPPGAPRAEELDLELVGRAVNLSGGSIRNAALHAAFLAADSGEPIGLPQVALAVWRELNKEGRDVSLSELGPLAGRLPEGEGR
jgi:DNA polymerase III delta prime subunit